MKSFTILSKHGQFEVLVDDEDFDRVISLKWHVSKYGNYMRVCNCHKGIKLKLHRFILGVTDPKIGIDHKDGNTLNNQKSNLRICSQANNAKNQVKRRNKKDPNDFGYKGIYFDKRRNKYRAHIRICYKSIHLGYFINQKDAIIAYNEAAVKYFGEFANLNVIKE